MTTWAYLLHYRIAFAFWSIFSFKRFIELAAPTILKWNLIKGLLVPRIDCADVLGPNTTPVSYSIECTNVRVANRRFTSKPA